MCLHNDNQVDVRACARTRVRCWANHSTKHGKIENKCESSRFDEYHEQIECEFRLDTWNWKVSIFIALSISLATMRPTQLFFPPFFFYSLYRCISTPNKVNRIFSNRYFVSLIMQTRRDFSSDYHSFTVYPIRIMIWYSEEFSIDFWSSHEMVECDRTCWGIKWNNGLQIRARCELIYLKLFFPDCEAYLNVLMRKKHTFTGKW